MRKFILVVATLTFAGLANTAIAQNKTATASTGSTSSTAFNTNKEIKNGIPKGVQLDLLDDKGNLTSSVTSETDVTAVPVVDKTRMVRGEHWVINGVKYFCIICTTCGKKNTMSCRPE